MDKSWTSGLVIGIVYLVIHLFWKYFENKARKIPTTEISTFPVILNVSWMARLPALFVACGMFSVYIYLYFFYENPNGRSVSWGFLFFSIFGVYGLIYFSHKKVILFQDRFEFVIFNKIKKCVYYSQVSRIWESNGLMVFEIMNQKRRVTIPLYFNDIGLLKKITLEKK